MKNIIYWMVVVVVLGMGIRAFNTFNPYVGIGIITLTTLIVYNHKIKKRKQ